MVVKVAWMIFSRAKSTRLPEKCYKTFNGKTTLERLIDRARNQDIQSSDIFLCTSIDKSCDKLCSIANNNGINILRGSEDYPIERITTKDAFLKLSKYPLFVRICGDSPFYSFDLVCKSMAKYYLPENNIFSITNTRLRNYPRGMSIEIYSTLLFKNLLEKYPFLLKREHMASILSDNDITSDLSIVDIQTNNKFLEILPSKLTLDTEDDYIRLSEMLKFGFDTYQKNVVAGSIVE